VVVVEVNGYTIEPGAKLRHVNLVGAKLRGADLDWACFNDANLTEADLAGADLTGANLTEANLQGANLTEANLTEADLTNALADEETTWPEGFDPVAAGVFEVVVVAIDDSDLRKSE
jgi:hypothetical protein